MNQNPEVSDFSTIVAEATPAGRGGIGIIRLSGPDVVVIGTALVGKLPDKRVAVTRFFKTANGSVIDQGLVLYFQGPASFTGEDVLDCTVPVAGLTEHESGKQLLLRIDEVGFEPPRLVVKELTIGTDVVTHQLQ